MADFPKQNAPYVRSGATGFNTTLEPAHESEFRSWLKQNNVPFQPDAPVTDYDMRGFFKALKSGDERAVSAIDMHDNKVHYPDYWKTPYHQTFSRESQWATPDAPYWQNDVLVDKNGLTLFDPRAQR